MILPSYAALRHHFAEVGRTTGVSLTYDNMSSPNAITRASGSFIDDGHVLGASMDVAGTTDNDARYTITSVTATTIEIAEMLNSSETITSSLTSAFYYTDGYELWPRDNVRAGGFDDTWSLTPRPITIFPAQLTVNGLITDVAAGSSYTWYLRQRTDDLSLQWFNVIHADPTRTGTVLLALTAKCVADLGLASAAVKLSPDQQQRVLRNVWVFCKRESDGAIQQADLFQLSHGTVL